ncbi:MAG: hypothetical protein GY853_07795 [PVC group bacterium]|nr:hypothetical protein [PVC group bacterium]
MNHVQKKPTRGRPKKQIKYTKTINVRLTHEQWLSVQVAAHGSHLEPSVFIRKTLLEYLDGRGHVAGKESQKPFKAVKLEPVNHLVSVAKKAPKALKTKSAELAHKQLHFDM